MSERDHYVLPGLSGRSVGVKFGSVGVSRVNGSLSLGIIGAQCAMDMHPVLSQVNFSTIYL